MRDDSFKENFGMYCEAILVSGKYGKFLVDPRDNVVGAELRIMGEWGALEFKKIKNIITRKSRVLVVGAHIGTLAIPISKKVTEVVAIEANPYTFNILRLNKLLNEAHNCTLINVAANNKYEQIEFLASTDNSGGSKRKPKIDDIMYTYDNPETILVKSAPLDSLLKNKNFDVVIMDIEGSEFFALQGMPKILDNTKTLIVEFIPHHIKNVSGISIVEFAAIFKNFKTLTLSIKKVAVDNKDFEYLLQHLYDNNISDEGLIFSK
jgi:FkbM family methyltransferase